MIASADGADACGEFFVSKRLYQIVVRTAVESFDAVVEFAECGDHNDRCRDSGFARFLQDQKSVHGREHPIEQHQIVGILQEQIESVAPVHADLHFVMLAL